MSIGVVAAVSVLSLNQQYIHLCHLPCTKLAVEAPEEAGVRLAGRKMVEGGAIVDLHQMGIMGRLCLASRWHLSPPLVLLMS